jgi:putative flippase GtrA
MSRFKPVHDLMAFVEARAPLGLVRFLAVGLGGLAVDQTSLTLCERAGVAFVFARAAAILIATLFTWLLNRRFTFGSSGRSTHHEALRYFGVAIAAQSVNFVASIGILGRVPHMPHNLAAFIGSVIATVFSYSGQRFFTFGRHAEISSTREPARD